MPNILEPVLVSASKDAPRKITVPSGTQDVVYRATQYGSTIGTIAAGTRLFVDRPVWIASASTTTEAADVRIDQLTPPKTTPELLSSVIGAPNPQLPGKVVISDFQGNETWTLGAAGSPTYDTSVFNFGTQSLRIDNAQVDATITDIRHTLPSTIDMSAKCIGFLVRVSDWQQIDKLDITVYSTADASSCTVQAAIPASTPWLQSQDWQYVTFSRSDFTTTSGAGVSWNAVTAIRIRTSSDAELTTVYPVWIQELFYFDQPATGHVSLCFDDGWASQYTIALPLLEDRGIRADFYLIDEAIGTGSYMSWKQVEDLARRGHGIHLHSHSAHVHGNGTGYAGVPADVLDLDLRYQHDVLRALGLNPKHLAYPLGRFTPDIAKIVRKYAKTGRTIWQTSAGGWQANTYPCQHPDRLLAWSIQSADASATVTAWTDLAATNKDHRILTFHKFSTAGNEDTLHWSTAKLTTALDALVTKRTAGTASIKPISELYA